MKDKFLIVGADSLIGRKLSQVLALEGVEFIETTRRKKALTTSNRIFLDLTQDISCGFVPEGITAAFLLAGVTSLDYCKKYPELSYRVNVSNTIKLVDKLKEKNIFIVFPSTNLVYDGEKPCRKESDPVFPLTEYGRQKAEVERFLLTLGPLSCIVRFTKIAESLIPLLIEWMNKLNMNEPVYPFLDKLLSPIPLVICTQGMITIAKNRYTGIFQFSGDRDITYDQLCYYLANRLKPNDDNTKKLIQPVSMRVRLPEGEANSLYTTLDTSRTRSKLHAVLPDSWVTVGLLIDDLLKISHER